VTEAEIGRDPRTSGSAAALNRAAICLGLLLATSAYGDKPSVEIYVDRDLIGLGEKSFLSIDIGYSELGKVDIDKPSWPPGLTQLTGPTLRTFVDNTDPDQPRKIRISYSFRGDRLGRLVVGRQSIRAGEFTLETDPFVLGVGFWRNREIYIPLQSEWRVDGSDFVVGQTLRALLVLRDMIEIPVIESAETGPAGGALITQIAEIGPLERTQVGNQTIYQLPVATFLVTPSRSGRVLLPVGSVRIGDSIVTTKPTEFTVRPAPDAISESGAVGAFLFSVEAEEGERSAGDEIELSLTLTGVGNLNYLTLPEPEVTGLVLSATEDVDAYEANYEGFEGSITRHFRYLTQSAGVAEIFVPQFRWFDPNVQMVMISEERRIAIQIHSPTPDEEPGDGFPFELETSGQILAKRAVLPYRNPASYLWLAPGVVAILVLAALKRMRIILVSVFVFLIGAGQSEKDEEIDRAIEAYQNSEFVLAAERFGVLLLRLPSNPGLHYNYSISLHRAGEKEKALTHIRSAIRSRPHDTNYRRYASWLNDLHQLPAIIYPGSRIDTGVLFVLGVACLIAASIAVLAQLLRNRGVFVIAAVLSTLGGAGAFTSLVLVHAQNARATGIVSEPDIGLRTIPNVVATVRRRLDSGTSMRIIDSAGGFHLVETGDGDTGWVVAESVHLDHSGG